jgi:hypothetical protein
MTAPRQPNQSDLLGLAQALAAFDVEYVVIGGAAMALHGFARMTKDIDLLLPVDPANNRAGPKGSTGRHKGNKGGRTVAR